jgi:glycosyltransferase involved in cell wall biosynthesis
MLFLHSFEPGGVERTALRLAGAWSAGGCAVTVAMGRDSGALAREAPVGPDYRFAKPFRWASRMESLWLLPFLVAEIRRARPDVLFCAGNTYAIVAVLARILLGRRTPPIVCKVSNSLERTDFGPIMARLYGLWLWLQGRLMDRFVALAEDARLEVERRMAVPPERVLVVHDPHVVAIRRRERRRAPEGRLYLGVGRLAPQKDFRLLIRAFALAAGPSDRLVILGEGPERAALERLAAGCGVADRTSFPGHTDPEAWMDRADAFVLSSRYEGLPAVVVEALARGAKVVATDCTASMRWLLGDERLGLIVPVGDPDALATAMKAVHGFEVDEALRRERVAAFALQTSAETYAALMRELSATRPVGRLSRREQARPPAAETQPAFLAEPAAGQG